MRSGFDLERRYESSGFFVARSALLPFRELVEWGHRQTPDVSGLDVGEARRELVRRLRRAFERAELRAAVLFASPELESRLSEWLASSRDDPKLERTLARYFARAAGRETPFGLFAGISLGTTGGAERFELLPQSSNVRRTRLGMAYLLRLLSELGAREDVRHRLRYEPSSTLYRACGRVRFASVNLEQQLAAAESYPVIDVEPSPHLDAALARATGGASLAEIAEAVGGPGVDPSEADGFARELVENQLLLPAWIPRVSGPEPLSALVSEIRDAGLGSEADTLEQTCRTLAELDRAPLGEALSGYREVLDATGRTVQGIEPSRRLQTDLEKPAEALALSPETLSELLRAAELVQRVSPPPRDLRLEEFRRRFEDRYEGRFVPLLEALDADLGIGYDRFESEAKGGLVEDLPFLGTALGAGSFDRWDALRLGLLARTLKGGGQSFELDTEWLEAFPKRQPEELPESFAVAVRLARAPGGPLKLICPSVLAPSAVSLLARFCHAVPDLERHVRNHVALEQARAGGVILADVVHLPNAHIANILLRPVLRDHEIPYLGKSGAPRERQLALDDLYVGVEAGRVVLHSQRLDRRISIRITNAHNFEGWWNLPLYRFLGALQNQDHGALAFGFDWGALEASPFLPRLLRGNVILSRARWLFSKHELEPLKRAEPAHAFELMQKLRDQHALPRWVTLPDLDQKLPIDLDNPLSVEVLLSEVRERAGFALEELLPAPDELLLSGPEGAFVSELVVPFVRRADAPSSVASGPNRPVTVKARFGLERELYSRPPGSDWLYVKAYAGRSQLSSVLRHAREAIELPEVRARVPLWFFVPLADPEPHLRLRFQGDPKVLLELVLPELRRALAPLLSNGTVFRLQLDTYEREIERYGGPLGMELSERLFAADSQAALDLLDLCEDDPELGWQLACLGIDRLFADLGLEVDARGKLARAAADDYGKESGATTDTWRKVGDKYRVHAEALSELLFPSGATSDPRVALAYDVFAERSRRLGEVREGLSALEARGALWVEKEQLLRSYAHMHAIRLLGDGARSYELVMYDFLRRCYAARTARAGARARNPRGSA